MLVKGGASSSAAVFRINVGMVSGPSALYGFKIFNSLVTPCILRLGPMNVMNGSFRVSSCTGTYIMSVGFLLAVALEEDIFTNDNRNCFVQSKIRLGCVYGRITV